MRAVSIVYKNMDDDARSFRRQLRKESMPPEKILWSHLRNRRLGNFKFRRQHSIGSYVVDIYHHDSKTVIEADGDVHFALEKQVEHDRVRQSWLEAKGFLVLRYNNVDIVNNLENILEEIYQTIIKRMNLPRS